MPGVVSLDWKGVAVVAAVVGVGGYLAYRAITKNNPEAFSVTSRNNVAAKAADSAFETVTGRNQSPATAGSGIGGAIWDWTHREVKDERGMVEIVPFYQVWR